MVAGPMRLCTVDGCETRYFCSGYCRAHYARSRSAAGLRPGVPIGRQRRVCPCGKPAHAQGYCKPHMQRIRKYGSPMFDRPLHGSVPPPPCAVAGCLELADARGWCSAHYQRWRELGDPGRAFDMEAPCPTCGREVDRSKRRNRRYCSRPCGWSGRGGRPTWRVVYERDEATCHLCAGYVDASVPAREPMAPTLDHVIPRSLGGSDELDNLRLAHLRCNMKRGTRPADVIRKLRDREGGE